MGPHFLHHTGLGLFAGLAAWDRKAGEARVEQRKEQREKQIQIGDREVFVNKQVCTAEQVRRTAECISIYAYRRSNVCTIPAAEGMDVLCGLCIDATGQTMGYPCCPTDALPSVPRYIICE